MKQIFHQQLSLAADQLFVARRQLEARDGPQPPQQLEQQMYSQEKQRPRQQQAEAAG